MSLKHRIVNILEKENLPGAIQISGEWGSGKSFFWNTEVVPLLPKDNVYIYVSLAGIKDIDLVYRKIVWQSFFPQLKKIPSSTISSFLKNSILFLLNSAQKIFYSGLNGFQLSKRYFLSRMIGAIDLSLLLPSRAIICFDDVERSKLSSSDLLRIILDLHEKYKSKTILIFNDESSSCSIQLNKDPNKEKLIWKRFQFQPEIENIYDSLVKENISQELHSLFSTHKETILSSFKKYKINLRVLLRCLIDIEDYLSTGKEIKPDSLYFFCSVYIWVNSGNPILSYDFYSGSMLWGIYMEEKRAEDHSKSEEEKAIREKCKEFSHVFFEGDVPNDPDSTMFEVIATGIINKNSLEENPEDTIHILISESWYFDTDEKLKERMEKILRVIEPIPSFDLDLYFNIFHRLISMSEHSSIPIPDQFERIKNLIFQKCASQNIKLREPHFVSSANIHQFMNELYDQYKEILLLNQIKLLEDKIQNSLSSNKTLHIAGIDLPLEEALATALTPKIISTVINNAKFAPITFYDFFFEVIELSGQSTQRTRHLDLLKDTLNNYAPYDSSDKARKNSLLSQLVKKM